MAINRTTDFLGCPAGFSLSPNYAVNYAHVAYGRFHSVTSSIESTTSTYTYGHLPNSDLISGMSASSGFLWIRAYESAHSLITSVENRFGETVISRYDYTNDELGRRTAISHSGQTFGEMPVRDTYGYNVRSEVTSARCTLADTPSQEVRGFSYDYAYDPIGNRITSTEYDHENNALVSAYTANALNQYERRSVPGYAGVRGTATNTATVTVNGNPAWRLDEYFYGGDEADNSISAIMKQLSITAIYNPPGTNDPDVVTSQTGRVFVAQTPETFQYDQDGNLTRDGRFTYTWDAENRLVGVTTRNDLPPEVPRVKVSYLYDHQSRRIASSTAVWTNDTWHATESRAFLYDGWNVIAETIQNQQSQITNHYVWGLDLSGSLQGAGGIGGLLSATFGGTTSVSSAFYGYDANGNVGQLVGTDGELLAHYEYSPFGETIVSTGPLAKANPFRFSTKWFDNDTGLGYWGYRYYHPEMGRWMSRDPIGERGGRLLYLSSKNDLVNIVDSNGLLPTPWPPPDGVNNPIPPEILPEDPKIPLPPPYGDIFEPGPVMPPFHGGLSTSHECATCGNMAEAIKKANNALGKGECRKWFEKRGQDYNQGLPEQFILCVPSCMPQCLLFPASTFPGMPIGYCENHCSEDPIVIASLLIHELAHHYCPWIPGPKGEECPISAQDACDGSLNGL